MLISTELPKSEVFIFAFLLNMASEFVTYVSNPEKTTCHIWRFVFTTLSDYQKVNVAKKNNKKSTKMFSLLVFCLTYFQTANNTFGK
jgi:hypothetical protein